MAKIRPRSAWTSTSNGRAGRGLRNADMLGVTYHWPGGGSNLLKLSAGRVAGLLRGWRSHHINGNGWADIGYNYAIDGKGRIWNLTGLNRGAHAGGTGAGNTRTVGVVLVIGTNETPNRAMLNAAKRLHAYIRTKLPNATRIYGHRDWTTTTCPGPAVYRAIQAGKFAGTASAAKPVKGTGDPHMEHVAGIYYAKAQPAGRPGKWRLMTIKKGKTKAGTRYVSVLTNGNGQRNLVTVRAQVRNMNAGDYTDIQLYTQAKAGNVKKSAVLRARIPAHGIGGRHDFAHIAESITIPKGHRLRIRTTSNNPKTTISNLNVDVYA